MKGAVQYRVTSLAFDPEAGTLFYTTDNLTFRNLLAYDLKTGKSKMLLKGQRIGDLAFNRADRSLWGLRTNNGFVILVRIPYPYTEWQPVHVFPYGEVAVRPGRVARRLAGVDLAGRARFEPRRGPGHAGPDHEDRGAARGRCDADAHARVRQLGPGGIRVLAGQPVPVRQLVLHRRFEHLSLRDRDRRDEAVSNAETGFFRPVPISDDELLVFNYTALGSSPR